MGYHYTLNHQIYKNQLKIKYKYTMSTQFNPDHLFNQIFSQMSTPEAKEQMKQFCAAFPSSSSPKTRCGRRERSCNKDENKICVPLKRFDAEQVNVNLNKNGLVTISASTEDTNEETGRNGVRKTTTLIEETVQLPAYVVENDLFSKVESKFVNGCLCITVPEDPKKTEEKEAEAKKNGPVEIPIVMMQD